MPQETLAEIAWLLFPLVLEVTHPHIGHILFLEVVTKACLVQGERNIILMTCFEITITIQRNFNFKL